MGKSQLLNALGEDGVCSGAVGQKSPSLYRARSLRQLATSAKGKCMLRYAESELETGSSGRLKLGRHVTTTSSLQGTCGSPPLRPCLLAFCSLRHRLPGAGEPAYLIDSPGRFFVPATAMQFPFRCAGARRFSIWDVEAADLKDRGSSAAKLLQSRLAGPLRRVPSGSWEVQVLQLQPPRGRRRKEGRRNCSLLLPGARMCR